MTYLPACLSVCLLLGLSVRLSNNLSVCLSISLSASQSVCLSISLSVCPSHCLSVCLSDSQVSMCLTDRLMFEFSCPLYIHSDMKDTGTLGNRGNPSPTCHNMQPLHLGLSEQCGGPRWQHMYHSILHDIMSLGVNKDPEVLSPWSCWTYSSTKPFRPTCSVSLLQSLRASTLLLLYCCHLGFRSSNRSIISLPLQQYCSILQQYCSILQLGSISEHSTF